MKQHTAKAHPREKQEIRPLWIAIFITGLSLVGGGFKNLLELATKLP